MQKPDGGKSAAKAARSGVCTASSPDLQTKTGLCTDTHSEQANWTAGLLKETDRQKVKERLEQPTARARAPAPNGSTGPLVGLPVSSRDTNQDMCRSRWAAPRADEAGRVPILKRPRVRPAPKRPEEIAR